MAENGTQNTADENKAVIHPQKIYVKDLSFETPNSPEIFQNRWEPSLSLDLGHAVSEIGQDLYEVVLSMTATVKSEDKTAYLVEVQQAGIFLIRGLPKQELLRKLNVFCPRTLYPYACSAASELVTRGGFPQLLLAPVNFGAIYQQRQAESDVSEDDD